jgi:hypothetical protein
MAVLWLVAALLGAEGRSLIADDEQPSSVGPRRLDDFVPFTPVNIDPVAEASALSSFNYSQFLLTFGTPLGVDETAEPTFDPTYNPTTEIPTFAPTESPTQNPTAAPTMVPTNPTAAPTMAPTGEYTAL